MRDDTTRLPPSVSRSAVPPAGCLTQGPKFNVNFTDLLLPLRHYASWKHTAELSQAATSPGVQERAGVSQSSNRFNKTRINKCKMINRCDIMLHNSTLVPRSEQNWLPDVFWSCTVSQSIIMRKMCLNCSYENALHFLIPHYFSCFSFHILVNNSRTFFCY